MKRKIEITFEVEEVIYYKTRKKRMGFCRQCSQTVETVDIEDAALSSGFSKFQVLRLLEAGGVHFVEADTYCICRNSLEDLGLDNQF